MSLYYIYMHVHKLLDLSLVIFPSFAHGCQLSVQTCLDHTGVWEIGCGSAPDGSIILVFCVNVPKTLYYKVLVKICMNFV